jgi:RNA recognition motif-containing protein
VKTEEQAAVESSENFAQTATEAPVEENLTPAQESAQAEPTNASATIGEDALEAVAEQGARRPFERRSGFGNRAESATPNPTIYVGNLYYEVNAEQLQRVFSRFGEIDNVKVIYDNRGMSRG